MSKKRQRRFQPSYPKRKCQRRRALRGQKEREEERREDDNGWREKDRGTSQKERDKSSAITKHYSSQNRKTKHNSALLQKAIDHRRSGEKRTLRHPVARSSIGEMRNRYSSTTDKKAAEKNLLREEEVEAVNYASVPIGGDFIGSGDKSSEKPAAFPGFDYIRGKLS